MPTPAIEQMLYLMDEAFDVPGNHPLVANMRSLQSDDWRWLPQDGRFQRGPMMLGEDEIAALRDALRKTPKLRAMLRRLVV